MTNEPTTRRPAKSKVPEALKVIASAWSVAFIVLFLYSGLCIPTHPAPTEDTVCAILILFAGAVTGAAWLYYRHKEKKHAD
jgi:uncharacterized membrane protein